MERIGTVAMVWRYPVKSMAGERLTSAPLTFQGIPGDREYAFVKADSRSSFPWLTGRDLPSLLHYHASYRADEKSPVLVRTPAGQAFAADSDELSRELASASGKQIHLLRDYRGSFDVAPVAVMALSTARHIAASTGTADDPLRYRMTVYIDTGSDEPFVENTWVGRELRLGGTARVGVTEPDKRCVMITLDHSTSPGSPAILKAVGQLNNAAAGAYAVVTASGELSEGDEVTIV